MSDGAVPAGRYRLRGFEPAITMDLDGSWQSPAQQDGYTSLVQVSRPAPSTAYFAGTLVQVTLVNSVVAQESSFLKPATAEEAVESIRRGLGSWVIDASDSRIGGRAGRQLTVERRGSGPPMSLDVVGVIGAPSGSIVLTPGDRLRIAFFTTAQGVVAIIVNGRIDDWAAQLAAAEPVLEGIRFDVP